MYLVKMFFMYGEKIWRSENYTLWSTTNIKPLLGKSPTRSLSFWRQIGWMNLPAFLAHINSWMQYSRRKYAFSSWILRPIIFGAAPRDDGDKVFGLPERTKPCKVFHVRFLCAVVHIETYLRYMNIWYLKMSLRFQTALPASMSIIAINAHHQFLKLVVYLRK